LSTRKPYEIILLRGKNLWEQAVPAKKGPKLPFLLVKSENIYAKLTIR
jgi:hypothetical protein